MFSTIFSFPKKVVNYLQRVQDARLLRDSNLFDPAWYLANHPDLAISNVDPLQHYLRHGGFEGRKSSPEFHSGWYLDTYPDVREAGLNPLVHYLRYGQKEHRKPKPDVYKLSRMYDYCKQANCIIFEESPEQIYLPRPNVKGLFFGTLNEGEAFCPRPYVSVIEDAIIFGGESLVVLNNHLVLDDELADFNSREYGKKSTHMQPYEDGMLLTGHEAPSLQIKEGILLSCGHDDNYFHWLVECLPKLLLVDSLEKFKNVPLLIPAGLHTNLMTALERLNRNNRKIIFVEPGSACQVERLVFPSALSRILDRYEGAPIFNEDIVLSHTWIKKVAEILRGSVNSSQKTWRKVFITRRKGKRAIRNREEVELRLLEQGFDIVDLDQASLDFQIKLFSQAAVVVAPTGAALTNMLFCQPGTKVIVFMSNHELTNYYFWTNLGNIAQVDVELIVGERVFLRTDYYSVHDDYVADVDLLLESFGKRHPLMNYGRYLYYRTLVTYIMENCLACCQTSTNTHPEDLTDFLKTVANTIRLKIQEVQIKQEGGYWPITKGDKLYIRYLNNTLVEVKKVLAMPAMDRKELQPFIDQLTLLLEKLETDHNPRLKAVFFVQESYTWTSLESVYEAFAANSACEAQLVYVDFQHVNNDTGQNWLIEYKKLGLPVIRCKDYDLSAESPDLAFFLKPYDTVPEQFYINEIEKVVSRSVYIPYFVNWMALQNIGFLINYHFQLALHEKAWKIFDSPDFILKSHIQYGPRKGENVELIGHPRFDILKKLEKRRTEIPTGWKEKFANKLVIMWNTHSYIATENWSTFRSFGSQVLEYFQNNQGMALLWRPHPHFFNSLINGNLMSEEEVEELIAQATDSGNIVLDRTSDYLTAFSIADALMSDASSMLVEFLLTRKPILYTSNKSNDSIVHENLLPAFYKATNWQEIFNFLQMLANGEDSKLDERTSVVENFMPNVGKNVGKLIMDKCIKDLVEEEVTSGRTLLQIGSEYVGLPETQS